MTKKLLALLLAVLMLVTLFSACANKDSKTDDTPSDNTADTPKTENKTDDKTDDTNKKDDQPTEQEPYTLTFLGCETNQWTFTLEEGIAKGFETWKAMEAHALDVYNFQLKRTVVDVSAYLTTLQGQLAADQVMDVVYTGFLANDALLNSVDQGRYANINDVLEYADQEVADYFSPEGCLNFIKAICVDENGDWYWFRMVNGGGTSLSLDHDDVDYLTDFSFNVHQMCIRYDWLEKLNMDVPTTTDEMFQAIDAMQDNDCNENGTADERIMLSLGDEENFFANGVASWYGLPTFPVGINTTNGAVEVAYTSVGYLPYIQYVKQYYDENLVYFLEGENYQSGVEIAGNYCSAHLIAPQTSRTATEDPNACYGPLPVIQAIEGVPVTPIIQCIGWGDERLVSYSSKVDLAAAGRFMSFLHSEFFYMTLIEGVEGVAWDWNDHDARTITKYTLSQDETYNYGGMFCFMPWAGWPQEMFFVKWGTAQSHYDKWSDYYTSGNMFKLFTGEVLTKQEYFEYYADKYNFPDYKGETYSGIELFVKFLVDYGEDKLSWRAWTKFGAAPTKDEAETIGMIGTDLLTYLAELSSAYVTGNKSMDNFEADIQYAYDSLNFQQYINIIQAQANRYLLAIGRDAVPIAE